MAPRAFWKGYLKLSLVSCPIALYPASTTSKRVAFHRINKATGNRLTQQMVDPQLRGPAEQDSTDRGQGPGEGEDRGESGKEVAMPAIVVEGARSAVAKEISRREHDSGPGQIEPQTDSPSKHEMVARVISGAVDKANIGREYEIGKGQYIKVTNEEIEQIRLESTHTIEIDSFVPGIEVDRRYLQTPYYISPTDKIGQEPFAVIREAIRVANMAALGRVVLAGRERVILLEPFERGLLGTTLRYCYEVRDPAPYFEAIAGIQIPAEMLNIAQHIVRTKSGHFDPLKFEDRYETALLGLLRDKQAGRQIEPIEAPRPQTVVNLMDALKKSLEAEAKVAPAERKSQGLATRKAKGARQLSGRSRGRRGSS
jgi:DNA end-binding protein Ku